MHLPVGITLQGGKYEIVRYISSGGFGCTYEARHTMLNTTVAIKEFFVKDYCNRDAQTYSISVATQGKVELIERLRKKFIEEAQAIFNMNHPNIVRVTDIFEENGTVYYVMDYIEGCSLASLISDKGRLGEKEALGYIHQVADALGYVHSCNRLHLDVKPQNIMIDKNGKAVLIDFGVSKQYDEVNGENTSTLLGSTPGYAPIEQSGNGIVRFYPSADIYALGATLYKALTGVTPVAAHLRASGEELDPLPDDITPATCEAVEAAMKINKAHRPQSIEEFLGKLKTASFDNIGSGSSSTPGGEVSRSDGGETELPKIKTASFDDDETRVGINPPRPSSTPPSEKVGEFSKADSNNEETRINSSSIPGVVQTESTKKTNKGKILAFVIAAVVLVGAVIGFIAGGSGEGNMDFTVNGVSFKMVAVEGGTFQMGATSEQQNPESNEKPVHSVTLSDYYIGETEVTQELWQAVMGSNPSYFTGNSQRPVEEVSWNDCQTFVNELNDLLAGQLPGGRRFRLPTEAEWEYAARGGNRSNQTQYSGSSNIDNVAWYHSNSGGTTHPVKQKQPNELGIYDMSGNVYEWCNDWYSSDYYSNSPRNNPQGPSSSPDSVRVLRGGSWSSGAQFCRVALRTDDSPGGRGDCGGLRLALVAGGSGEGNNDNISSTSSYTSNYDSNDNISSTSSYTCNYDSNGNMDFTVNGVEFKMVAVECGTFQMGATSEQQNTQSYEKPVHSVTLSDYYIGETEVTQALWQAVMGSNPSRFTGDLQRPVEQVSYKDCETFINKLNTLLANQLPNGLKFRFPTEAQWEYAARGGNRSNGHQYSGSSSVGSVAWYDGNSGNTTHPVKGKSPNELGIYDMSGNVLEWCNDWYSNDYYSNSPRNNPQGPSWGSYRVLRGGSWFSYAQYCRVADRSRNSPDYRDYDYGLRLAL